MNSKRKGNQAERELLHLLQAYGIEAARNDQRYTGGVDNPDIAAKIGPVALHVEVKRQERLALPAALRQAKRDANGHALPIVVHRSNRQPAPCPQALALGEWKKTHLPTWLFLPTLSKTWLQK